MKSMVRLLNTLALIHFYALIGFVVWLWQTDRLSMDRLDALRTTFADTLEASEAAALEQERQVQQARLDQEEENRRTNPPVSSAERIGSGSILREQERQALQRLRDEKHLLMSQLDTARQEIKQLSSQLATDREEFQADRADDAQDASEAQFQQVVKMYESAPSRQAKDMLKGLVTSGNRDQAIAYLNAMQDRPRSKILREFKSPEELKMATDLLEGLRVLGESAESNEDTPDDKPLASLPESDDPASGTVRSV